MTSDDTLVRAADAALRMKDLEYAPKLPRRSKKTTTDEHRTKIPEYSVPFNACVARPVTGDEKRTHPKALAALAKEWKRLRDINTWDESKVREWRDVANEAKATGIEAHVGRIFDICVEKNSELNESDPSRKYKGRVVFQGNNVLDHNWEVAMFQEMSSCPATMGAAKAADCYGLLPGNHVMQADADMAYTQATLGGTPTWVRLPKEQWPKEWHDRGYKDPVCPLIRALYGHPDAGGYWEKHCEAHLLKCGFEPVKEWRSCFWHERLQLFLVVYVDDFKLAGPKTSFEEAWKLIRAGVKMGDPEEVGHYLGCRHEITSRIDPVTKKQVRVMEYNCEDFLTDCVNRYKELAKVSVLKPVATPFIEESTSNSFPPDSGNNVPAVQAGELQPIAACVLMKVLYGARMARFDLLRAVNGLACKVTKWDQECDRKLHRLMCYINCSKDIRMTGWVGDGKGDLGPHLFADADFAGDPETMRSTSGVFLTITGPNSSFPLAAVSKRQSAVSHSTPEAEIVAADLALRTEGIPAIELWSKLLGKDLKIVFHEDNQAMIAVCKSGKNPTMRHLNRTHKVDIAWLHERFQEPEFELVYTVTTEQAADIFTKGFTDRDKWRHAQSLINHFVPHEFWTALPSTGGFKNAAGKDKSSKPAAAATELGGIEAKPANELMDVAAAATSSGEGNALAGKIWFEPSIMIDADDWDTLYEPLKEKTDIRVLFLDADGQTIEVRDIKDATCMVSHSNDHLKEWPRVHRVITSSKQECLRNAVIRHVKSHTPAYLGIPKPGTVCAAKPKHHWATAPWTGLPTLSITKRTDRFQSTKSLGIAWWRVVRRITSDKDGKIIDDDCRIAERGMESAHRMLPGCEQQETNTVFFLRPDPEQATAAASPLSNKTKSAFGTHKNAPVDGGGNASAVVESMNPRRLVVEF